MLRRAALMLLFVLIASAPFARAQVTATYYSMDFGENFPHAFVHLTGTRDDGTPVDQFLGFSAKVVTPQILLSSVGGEVIRRTPKFLDVSEPRFALILTDQQYTDILRLADDWEENRLKYNLNNRNCIHFVADTIQLIGLKVNWDSEYFKKPKGFLREVSRINEGYVIDLDGKESRISTEIYPD